MTKLTKLETLQKNVVDTKAAYDAAFDVAYDSADAAYDAAFDVAVAAAYAALVKAKRELNEYLKEQDND